ncbi:MAG: phosphotransferase [Firmicutes bacterium]|nr:phosphotransferase [Bacillota bacterium]
MGRMRKRRRLGFHSVLDQYQVLQSIADDYDLRILQVEKENGVFKVNTSQGWKKVKFFKYSQAELDYVHGALEHLAGKGWKRSMPLHLTKDGAPYVETPQGLVYASAWVQGTEVDPEDPFHLEMAVKVLGEMHRLVQDYRGVGECHRQIAPNWQEKYGRQAEDLEKYRQQAESARRGKFGRRFCQVADDFIRIMGIGLQLLDEGDYELLSQEAELITTCHTSPIASNLIAGNDGKIYVIDFDNARSDLRIYDLGRMLIRHSDWDVDKALFLIKSYQEANPLTREEMALLPALCALSNRGWQVARSFYEQGKIHLERLERAIDELAKQEAFAKALAQVQPSKLVHSPVQLFQTIPYPLPVSVEAESEELPVVVSEVPEIEIQADSHPEAEGKYEIPETPQPDTGEPDHWPQSFYWGDEDTEYGQLEDEELWALRHELASLARRLETISGAMFTEEPVGGDAWMGERHISEPSQEGVQVDDAMQPGVEIPVEIPRGHKEESPSIPIMAGVGECPSDMGEEVMVQEGMGAFDLQLGKEGEVRLDQAVDMEHINREVPIEEAVSLREDRGGVVQDNEMPVLTGPGVKPMELIEPGMEIPVEYAVGLEQVEGKEVTYKAPMPPEVLRGGPATQEMVLKAASPEAEDSEEGTVQLTVAADQLDQVMPVSEEKVSEAWEAAAPAAKEPGPEAEREIAFQLVLAEEAEGEKMIGDGKQPELISPSPGTRGSTVEWASFPEPLGRRRRGRERRSL